MLVTDLDALLDAWRATGSPELADAIDRVSAALVGAEPPIRAIGGTSAKAAWYGAVAAYRPVALPRLLESAAEPNDRVQRLLAFTELPPDPRMGTFVRMWLEEPPVTGKNRSGFYAAVCEIIAHVKDVRLTPVLERFVAIKTSAISRYGQSNYKLLVAVTAAMAKQAPKRLDDAARALLSRVDATLARPADANSPSELFDRVYADPADDDVRAVLADLLSERGDPRGEFINLQLARHGTSKRKSPRERELESTWGRTWLGPIEPVVLKGGVEFERGFVSQLRYAGGSDEAAVLAAREWSTVVAIDATPASARRPGSRALLVTPVLRSLREVIGLNEDDLDGIIENLGHIPWPTVGCHVWYWARIATVVANRRADAPFDAVRKLVITSANLGPWTVPVSQIVELLSAFPALEEADLEVRTDAVPLLKQPEIRRLRRLTLRVRDDAQTFEPSKLAE